MLLYSHQSRPLSILLLEYSFTGELERGAALGLLVTMIIGLMMMVEGRIRIAARRIGLDQLGVLMARSLRLGWFVYCRFG